MIKCPIYRFIRLPDLCKKFLDTPEVQRLRNIKQLGFVHYVYPSAVHTRLEHSLGVMHLAGEAANVLIDKGFHITQREKELLQLAGLLHDVGHIAFSHLFDDLLIEQGYPCHEQRSVELLKRINDRLSLLTSVEVKMVEAMITGNPGKWKRPFLFQIVANHIGDGIDVDRMDYLQRDAYHTGMPGFQPDYLINCMTVTYGYLSFLEKAKSDIQLVCTTRKRMFECVYRHKTVKHVEEKVKAIIKDLKILTQYSWEDIDDPRVICDMRTHPLYRTIEERDWK